MNKLSTQCAGCRSKSRKRQERPHRRAWIVAKSDCCPEWKDYAAFHEWAEKTKDGRVFRRRDESLPHSPANCFWSNTLPNGDRFRDTVAKLRQEVLGEPLEVASQWVSSVTRQRAHQWYRQNLTRQSGAC